MVKETTLTKWDTVDKTVTHTTIPSGADTLGREH
jgi:hypothetical protein